MKKIIFCIIIIAISACNNTSPALKIEKAYKAWGDMQPRNSDSVKILKGSSVAMLRYNSNNKLMRLEMVTDGHQYGHKFQFDTKGSLYEYQFYVNPSNFSYEISRKFMGDSMMEMGSPFVDYMKQKGNEKQISLLFSDFPRKIVSVQFSTDGIKYTDLHLYESKFMPLLLESDIVVPMHGKIFLKTKTNELRIPLIGLDAQKLFYDTSVVSLNRIGNVSH